MTTIMQLSFGIVVVDDENDEDDNGYSKREVTKKEEGLGGTKGVNVTNETMTTPTPDCCSGLSKHPPMTTLTTVVPTIFPSPLPTHDNGRPNDFPFAIVDAADLRRERNRKRMARIRSKSKEVRDARYRP